MSDPSGTRRERDVLAAHGTRREGATGTRREGTDAGGTRRERTTGAAEFISVNLPARLAERFRVVEEIPTQGAEATVMVVDELESGAQRVLKLYRRGIDLDRDAVERLKALSQSDEGRPHIVTLFEAEVEAGLWYEVQEFCPDRSLREVLRARPVDAGALASEMAPALAFLEGELFLRDLKPENLLVRTVEPFDVVVADFGLARNAQAGSVRWTEGGTAAYMPPEAGLNRVTRSWDWWSAGMVLAEVALGRHPLADPDGHLPPSLQILDLISRTPIDLTGIADDHLRHLCRGLLVRDPERRWRAEQVQAWLVGERPEVPGDETTQLIAVAAAQPGPTSTVRFGGTAYDDARELAAAFQQRWDYALVRLFQDRDAAWIAELDTFLRERELTAAAQIVADGAPSATDLPARMASLLVEMDPLLEPVFDGVRVTPAGLADAAHAVVSGQQSGLQGQLRQIREAGVLTLWTSLPGMSLGARIGDKIDETWQRDCRQLDELATSVRGAGQAPPADVLEVAKARLLLCALDPKQQARLQRSLRHRRSLERTISWWRVLADQARTSLPAAALAVMLAPEAKYAAEQEKHRQEDADPTSAVSRQRDRAVLTQQALGPVRRPALLASVPVLLLGLLWLAVHFEARIGFFLVSTSDGDERRNVITPDDVRSLVDAAPRIIGLAVACVVVQIVGAWSRTRRLSSATARGYVAVSAVVQGAAAGALIGLGAVGTVLGYIANALDDKGFPEDYVPGSCKLLVAAGVVVLGAVYLLAMSLRRLALALFGGQVIAR